MSQIEKEKEKERERDRERERERYYKPESREPSNSEPPYMRAPENEEKDW
jgi:hypothetical protein